MEVSVINRIHKGAIQFLDDLIGWLPNNHDLIMARLAVDTQIPAVILADTLLGTILPFKDAIKNRDEKFILSDPNLLSKGGDKALSLKAIWTGSDFSKDDKDIVWKWLDVFVDLLTLYDNLKRSRDSR